MVNGYQKYTLATHKRSTGRAFQGLTSDKPKHTISIDTQQSAPPFSTHLWIVFTLYIINGGKKL